MKLLFEIIVVALGAIRANALRSILTALGIIIGIVAVSTTMTAANGLADNFRENVSVLGTDVLYVSRMPWVIQGDFFLYFQNSMIVTVARVSATSCTCLVLICTSSRSPSRPDTVVWIER